MINVSIKSYNDYKKAFGDIYCQNRQLSNKYKSESFHFMIEILDDYNNEEKIKILKGFKQIKTTYTSAEFVLTVKIIIKKPNDYDFFFKAFVDPNWEEKNPKIINLYKNSIFFFEVDCLNQKKVDELLIHNFLLIKNVFENSSAKFILNIKTNERAIGRLNTYTTGHDLNNSITFNEKLISWNITSVYKLFPALFTNQETLLFLQSPITDDAWKHIIGEKITKDSMFKESINKRYWFVLRACQNYLFSEYKDVHSYAYTTLRKATFCSSKFKEYIKRIPLMALLIFSQYDHYYRSSMLKEYKDLIGSVTLNYADFVVALQNIQDYSNFQKYQTINNNDIKTLIAYDNTQVNLVDEIQKSKLYIDLIEIIDTCKKQLDTERKEIEKEYACSLRINSKNNVALTNDIFEFYLTTNVSEFDFSRFLKKELPQLGLSNKKSLLESTINIIEHKLKEKYEKIIDTLNIKYSPEYKNFKTIQEYNIHADIVAELFEASTITEGLLQLIENSVTHASGGLLSMHIYNMLDDNDATYLHRIYAIDKKVSNFWLEIELSDLCGSSIKEKFIINAEERIPDDDDLKAILNSFRNDSNDVFKLFFEPHSIKNGVDFWEKYYQIAGNQIHHYGLQIFESIIKAKNGLFVASGHGHYYSEKKDIPSDINIKGTSYRILLPLNHIYTEDKNIINNTTHEKMMSYANMKDYYDKNDKINQIFILNKKVIDLITLSYDNNDDKEEAIKTIKDEIKQIFLANNIGPKYMLLIDCMELEHYENYKLELLIKGLLLFLFSCNEKPPVAIFNMHSHELLEATRIIALFYNKQGNSTSNMKGVQIYLRGNEIGEDILFVGENLNWNAERMRKIAMTRGLMFDYWSIAQILMQRPKEKSNKNKDENID